MERWVALRLGKQDAAAGVVAGVQPAAGLRKVASELAAGGAERLDIAAAAQ